MNQFEEHKIAALVQNGYKASFGRAFNEASDIFKGIAGYSILAFVLYLIFSTVLSSIVGIIMPGSTMDIEEMIEVLQSGDEELINAFILEANENPNYIPSILNYLLQSALYPIVYSIYTMARKYDLNQDINISDIFIHYRDGKFLTLFLLTIVVNIIAVIGFMLCIIPGILVYIFFMLSVPLIIFADANLKEALLNSYKVVSKDFGTFTVALLAMVGIILVGILLCCIGLIAAYPFTMVLIYVLYKHVIGFSNETTELDEIGSDIYKDNPYMK